MEMKYLKSLAALLLVSSLLSGCQLQEMIFGSGKHEATVPVGDFDGSWKYQDPLAAEENIRKSVKKRLGEPDLVEAQELNADKKDKKALAALEKAQAEELSKIEEENKKIKADYDAKVEELVQKQLTNNENRDVKITLLPLDPADDVGLGIIVFRNSSHRFFWEAKGNRKDTWNIQFTKDNNVYTNITYGFNFSGFMKKSNIGYDLNGALHINDQGQEENIFIETRRILDPELFELKAEDAIGKMGESITISGKHFDEDPSKNKITLNALESKKDPAPKYEPEIANLDTKDPENNSFTIKIPKKEWEKGKYSLTLLRGDGKKTNTVTIEIQ